MIRQNRAKVNSYIVVPELGIHHQRRSACGDEFLTSWGATGGGRVAVRLSDPAADFAAFDSARFNVAGGSSTLSGNPTNYFFMASAGTVYLQPGNVEEGAGTVVVANGDNAANNYAVTAFP